ncbi:hypothetical protein scyTo_0012310 [Scyliorhinus torazame]|uniref:Uncharacterized protein n=1 Tax=Scyliorhinus torazame TaxID=75743 RepID=A0A401P691_SCYTO|nr:hypothetical protein [Scyliorhinus torazame]
MLLSRRPLEPVDKASNQTFDHQKLELHGETDGQRSNIQRIWYQGQPIQEKLYTDNIEHLVTTRTLFHFSFKCLG